jgi:glycosyltransferase involved in cell wall biosynthesis
MKPRIAILADVRNWAWARKTEQLVRHLGDEFRFDVAFLFDPKRPDPIPAGADLYHTYEVFQASRLPQLDRLPYVTGITAHVWKTWEERFGAGTVRGWSKGALAFHANSRLLEAEVRALLGRPIDYCPNGVDETFFRRLRPRQRHARLVVGWVGKPNPRKGPSIVEEACRTSGAELRKIERTHANALGPEEMREFYQDLDVLAVASDMDGTPNPALEAAACGVAVVSNRIGNMPEFITDGVNGRLVERTAPSIAAALRQLAGDPHAVIRMGEAARAEIERAWTWRDLSRNYAAMWTAALTNQRSKAA